MFARGKMNAVQDIDNKKKSAYYGKHVGAMSVSKLWMKTLQLVERIAGKQDCDITKRKNIRKKRVE